MTNESTESESEVEENVFLSWAQLCRSHQLVRDSRGGSVSSNKLGNYVCRAGSIRISIRHVRFDLLSHGNLFSYCDVFFFSPMQSRTPKMFSNSNQCDFDSIEIDLFEKFMFFFSNCHPAAIVPRHYLAYSGVPKRYIDPTTSERNTLDAASSHALSQPPILRRSLE